MSNTGFKGINVLQTGNEILFDAFLQTSGGALLGTGTTVISIQELQSDATIKSYDFNDNTFKTTALTTPTLALTHRPSNNAATTTGYWTAALSTLTGFTIGGIYLVICNNTGAYPTDAMRKFQYGSAEGDLVTTANGTGVAELNVDIQEIKGQAVVASGTVTFPNATLASTTGAVGSVTGAVGSVTGNVGGNVTGTVASVVGNVGGNVSGNVSGSAGSVTGAVGSVTGNVGGNIVGTVASVVGNVGGNVVGNVNGNVSGSVGSVAGAVGSVTGAVGSVTGNVGGNVVGSTASVSGAVGSVTGNVGGDVAGKVLGGGAGSISGDGVRASSVTGAVGSVTGSVGSVVGLTPSNLDTTVSSRLATGGYTAPANASIAAIKVVSDELAIMINSTPQFTATALALGGGGSGGGVIYGENGSSTYTFTVFSNDGITPLAGASVYVSSDSAGANRSQLKLTDAVGKVQFSLDPGTVYFWTFYPGRTFTNPTAETVV